MQRYFRLFLLVVFFSSNAFAEDYCYFSKQYDAALKSVTVYQFEKTKLICAEKNKLENLKNLSVTDLDLTAISAFKIIRSNINELHNVKILASSHGYHLVKSNIDCNKIHCQHVTIMPLSAWHSVTKPKNSKKVTIKTTTLDAVNQLDSSLWLANVVTLSSWSRQSGSTGNNSAKTWIQSKMDNLGLNTSTQSFTVNGNVTYNIIGVQTGTTRVNEWYIVGAHMDSRPFSGNAPGAVDNASGCAAVLETARVATMHSFEGTILYICYSGEEQFLIGSNYHVNSLINNGNQNKVKAALIMDMVGYTSNAGHDLLLETSVTNQWLMNLIAQNANTYAPNLNISMSTNPWGSDHVPYINNNMHGILLIDDDWGVYPAYHQSNDLPENLNLIQGEYILKTNLASLAQLAGLIETSDLIFSSNFE